MNRQSRDVVMPSVPPRPALVPLGRRVFWPFTQAGRTLHTLLRAGRKPADPRRIAALARAVARLRQGKTTDRHEQLIADGLSLLAWAALERNAPAEARELLRGLRTLDIRCPERLTLQGRLLDVLLDARDLIGYAAEAKILLGDPILTWVGHPGLVHSTLRGLYEDVSPQECALVLQSTPRSLRESPPVAAVESLCRRGHGFGSAEAAAAWSTLMVNRLEALAFSPRMFADALIGLAQAAEWQGAWEAMLKYAERAHATLPDDTAAYWQLRAALYPGEAVPDTSGLRHEETRPWARLHLLARLRANPDTAAVERLLALCTPDRESPDEPEKRLIGDLARPALAVGDDPDVDDLFHKAALAATLTQRIGRHPWVEVLVAHRLIRVDQHYEEALTRLDAADVACEPNAMILARVARLMLGAPAQQAIDSVPETLACLEQGLRCLLVPGPGTKSGDSRPVLPTSAQVLSVRNTSLVRRFPALGEAAAAIGTALATVAGDPVETASVAPGGTQAPDWVHWLLTRCAVLRPAPAERAAAAARAERVCPAVRWELARWAAQDPRAPVTPVDLPPRPTRPAADVALFPELGTLAAAVVTIELALERDCAAARADLAAGRAEPALALLRSIDASLAGQSALTAATWGPIVRYWLGVATAHLGRPEAATILADLVPGFKGMEASAQLGLLAIREGDLPAAERWVAGIDPQLPAGLYARALLAARRGDAAEAQRLADTFLATCPQAQGPYAPAMERLLAAMEERAGQIAEAEARLESLLLTAPQDGIAAARLRRLRLQREYEGLRQPPTGTTIAAVDGLAPAADTVTWSMPYGALRAVLGCPVPELDCWRSRLSGPATGDASPDGPAWRQVLVRRLLEISRPDEARAELAKATEGRVEPPWQRRTRWILDAWGLAAAAGKAPWASANESAVRAQLNALTGLSNTVRDSETARWAGLLRIGASLAAGEAAPDAPWTVLDPWPLAWVPALWSTEPAERSRATTAVAPMLTPGSGWDERQRQLLDALLAWEGGREDDFLTAYAGLEPDLEVLPIQGAELWLAAAGLWLRKDQWDRLTEGDLPGCVADLADPRARLLVGLAYARAAVADTRRDDVRRAVEYIKRARGTLSELLPETAAG